jgi:hypothetical protein
MTSYWISDICVLFNSFEINPFKGPDRNFKYNALTRLIIVVTLISAIFFNNYKEIGLTGVISILVSVLIYFVSFNKDMNYKNYNTIESNKKNEIMNASDFEKIKLSDENVNKKNLSIVRFRKETDTNNLSKTFFLKDKDGDKKDSGVDANINSEKYNIAPRSKPISGTMVFNDIGKNDLNKNVRVSDITFKL